MFRFDMSKIDNHDLNDTIESLLLLTAANVTGQTDNLGFHYLLNLASDEAELRNNGEIGDEIGIELPFSEMTGAHVWALLQFTGAVVEAAAKGEPSATVQFFARIIEEIEFAALRVASATNN